MSVKDFLVTKVGAPLLNTTLAGVQTEVGIATLATLGKSKASEFAGEVRALVSNEDFIAQLSEDIGEPKEAETEEEFVNRAKQTMKDLLKSKLK